MVNLLWPKVVKTIGFFIDIALFIVALILYVNNLFIRQSAKFTKMRVGLVAPLKTERE
jgi:hypothetical protein